MHLFFFKDKKKREAEILHQSANAKANGYAFKYFQEYIELYRIDFVNNMYMYCVSYAQVLIYMYTPFMYILSKFCFAWNRHGEVELDWIESLELNPLSDMLHIIYLQALESMADARWELRRMGQQVSVPQTVLHQYMFRLRD